MIRHGVAGIIISMALTLINNCCLITVAGAIFRAVRVNSADRWRAGW